MGFGEYFIFTMVAAIIIISIVQFFANRKHRHLIRVGFTAYRVYSEQTERYFILYIRESYERLTSEEVKCIPYRDLKEIYD